MTPSPSPDLLVGAALTATILPGPNEGSASRIAANAEPHRTIVTVSAAPTSRRGEAEGFMALEDAPGALRIPGNNRRPVLVSDGT